GRAVGAGAGAVLRHVAQTRGGTAGCGRGDEAVGRAVVPDPVAELGDVAQARAGAALAGALRVRGAVGARARAEPGQVAVAGCRTARRRRRGKAVGRAVVADPVAELREVAVAGRGATRGRALPVGQAGGIGAGARLRDVACAGGGTADGGRRRE